MEIGTFILSWPSENAYVLLKITATCLFFCFLFLIFSLYGCKFFSCRQASAHCINLEQVPHADCRRLLIVHWIRHFGIITPNYFLYSTVLDKWRYSRTICSVMVYTLPLTAASTLLIGELPVNSLSLCTICLIHVQRMLSLQEVLHRFGKHFTYTCEVLEQ